MLPPMVGHLNDGVCCFQDWIPSRPGFVCDVMLVRMFYFLEVYCEGGIRLPGQSQSGTQD